MNWKHLKLALFATFVLIFFCGCASKYNKEYHEKMSSAFYTGDTATAFSMAKEASDAEIAEYDENALFWHFEYASTALHNDDYINSFLGLKRAEKLLYLYDRQGHSDYQRPGKVDYVGLRAERLILNTLKVFNYFQQDNFEDALMEIRRLRVAQFDYLQNAVDPEIKVYEEMFSSKVLPSKKMNDILSSQTSARAVYYELALPEEFNAQKRPSLALMSNPLGFYMSALGYYFDDDYEEALIDLKYLLELDPDNELYQKDYVTLLRAMHDDVPKQYEKVKSHDYALNDKLVVVIFAHGFPMGWETKQANFKLPGMVPAYWKLSYPAKSQNALLDFTVVTNQGQKKLSKLVDLQDVLFDEYCQEILPQMLKSTAAAIEGMTAAHIAAQASLAAAYAISDPKARSIAIISAAAAVNSTKDITLNHTEWRNWMTIANKYNVGHLPIPSDGKINIEIKNVNGEVFAKQNFEIKKDVNRAIIYVRVMGNKVYSKLYESFD